MELNWIISAPVTTLLTKEPLAPLTRSLTGISLHIDVV